MKCAFTFNGHRYISPSKKEARRFLRAFGEYSVPHRYVTSWRLKHVERAPSYCEHIILVEKDRVVFMAGKIKSKEYSDD